MYKSLNRKQKAKHHMEQAKSIAVDMTLEYIDDDDYYDDEPAKKIPVRVVTVRIDNKQIEMTHDALALFHEWHPVHIGWDENKAKGQYFLTCSCGVAGCAGYWEPVVIRVKKDTVQWSVRKEHGYGDGVVGTGENVIYLKRKDYEECRKAILHMLRSYPDDNFMFGGTRSLGSEWIECLEIAAEKFKLNTLATLLK